MKNGKIYNPPQFKIHGQERRDIKKKVSLMRRDLRSFDFRHSLHKDMCMVYGCECIDDEDVEEYKHDTCAEIMEIEKALAEPYSEEIG